MTALKLGSVATTEEKLMDMIRAPDFLQAALSCIERGWSVIPLRPKDKRPLLPAWAEYQNRRPVEQEVQAWWRDHPDANVGIVTGAISGLVVLDLDGPEAVAYAKERGVPETPAVKTGKGWHLYFAHPGETVANAVALGGVKGLDLQGDGGYVIAPPSIHPSGQSYVWAKGHGPDDLPLAPLPEWVLQLRKQLPEGGGKAKINPLTVLAGVPEGQRDVTLFRYACRLRRQGLTKEEALCLVLKAAANCQPPFPEREAKQKVEQAFKFPPGTNIQDKAVTKTWTAEEIVAADFPEPSWLVPGLVPEGGLTLLAGRPKIGKSWLALDIAIGLAAGGEVCGVPVPELIPTLYLALEDSPQRIKSRIATAGLQATRNCYFVFAAPKLPDLLHFLRRQVLETEAKVVIIDVLAKIKPRRGWDGDLYADDYEALSSLKALADELGITLLVLHHLRKAEAEDPLVEICGTVGVSCAVDTVLVLKRARGQADGTLDFISRDAREIKHALRFENCRWRILGDAREYAISEERGQVLEAVEALGSGTPKEIAEVLGKTTGAVKFLLRKLADDGLVKSNNGKYSLTTNPTYSTNYPYSTNSANPDGSVSGLVIGEKTTNPSKPYSDKGLEPSVSGVRGVSDNGLKTKRFTANQPAETEKTPPLSTKAQPDPTFNPSEWEEDL